MKEKKQIALVSITLNAVNPMERFLKKNAPELKVYHYLDSFLHEKIRLDGGITDESMGRMIHMIAQSIRDGADAVLITCTVFSPYQHLLSGLFSVPVISADGAMLDQVSRETGKKAILCTFESTVELTRGQYQSFCRANQTSEEVDLYVIPEAMKAQQAGEKERGLELIRQKVRELDRQYDHIVLAQISMSEAAEGLQTEHARVYTSPSSALEALYGR